MAKPNPRNPIHLLAAGFGSGLTPRAPGTFGSLAALLPWWPLQQLAPLYYWAVIAVGFLIGVYVCGKTARDLRTHDHSAIVWDEFIGLWIALAWLPTQSLSLHGLMSLQDPISLQWFLIAVGFGLFRLFDIWKPWPISWCDRNIHGGFGIMFDDVLAGALAAAVLQIGIVLLD